GWHVHMLVHIPRHCLDGLGKRMRRWIENIGRCKYRSGMVRDVSVGKRVGLERSNPALYEENLINIVGYMVKQMASDAAERFGCQHAVSEGRIIGKRC